MVTVVGIKSPEGKPQHLVEGKEYEVTEAAAKSIIANKQGKKK